jgi:hypothetical protein
MSLISYHPRTSHSTGYYHRLIEALIAALHAHASDAGIAAKLNGDGIKSPSGKDWSVSSVKTMLFGIRNHHERPSKVHQALLQLCFDQVLRPAETLILFSKRNQTKDVM